MSAHAATPEELKSRRTKYINVFWGLVVLTAIELFIVQLGHWFPQWPRVLIVCGIVLFSSAKAVVVGYYYMHLEHETKWLKFVACLPVIAFLYAFFLVHDVRSDRQMSVYMYEPARTYPAVMLDRAKLSSHHGGHAAQGEASEHGANAEHAESVDGATAHGEAAAPKEAKVIEYNEKSGESAQEAPKAEAKPEEKK